MVRPHRDIVVDVILVGTHRRPHIRRVVIVPRLDESIGATFYLAEVNEIDAFAELSEVSKMSTQRRNASLTERNTVVITIIRTEAVVGSDAIDDSRMSLSEWVGGAGQIVQAQPEFYAGLHGN